MFRRWLSNFFRNNKTKIKQIGKLFGLLILIGIVAVTIFSTLGNKNQEKDNNSNQVYNPSATVISGDNISKEEFEEENDLIKTFINYCNDGKLDEAYNLLTDECKEKLYPTVEEFKNKYYSIIFKERREYSLQSWVNGKGFNTYKVNFTVDILSRGDYDNVEKFEDYITVILNEKNESKLNINSYIKTEKLNKVTAREGIKFEILKEDIYLDYIEYVISAKNTTDKEVLLDSMTNSESIKLIGTNGREYGLNNKNLKAISLKVLPGEKRTIKLKFKKPQSIDSLGMEIEFKKVILDYVKYTKDTENYSDYADIKTAVR